MKKLLLESATVARAPHRTLRTVLSGVFRRSVASRPPRAGTLLGAFVDHQHLQLVAVEPDLSGGQMSQLARTEAQYKLLMDDALDLSQLTTAVMIGGKWFCWTGVARTRSSSPAAPAIYRELYREFESFHVRLARPLKITHVGLLRYKRFVQEKPAAVFVRAGDSLYLHFRIESPSQEDLDHYMREQRTSPIGRS